MHRFLICFLAGVVASPAVANDLLRAYEAALSNDAQLRAAAQALAADEQLAPAARGAYLPQIAVSGSIAQDRFTLKDAPNQTGGTEDITVTGDPFQVSLQITQAVFNRRLWLQWQQSHDRAAAAQARYRATEQELAVRVTRAYFDVLAAQDNQTFAEAEKAAVERQLEHARKRFEVGVSTVTDMHEAQARYDLTVAQLAETSQQLRNAKDAFIEITGAPSNHLMPLREEMSLTGPAPDKVQAWVDAALENNLEVMASRINAEIASKDIKLARSGHYPTLDLTGTHFTGEGAAFNQGAFENTQLRLTLNLPLFSGGTTYAGVRRNLSLHEQRLAEFEVARRRAERQVRNAFESIQTGIVRINALRQALVSNREALEASEAGLKVGARNAVDVLNAQRQLSLTQREHARARYDYVVNTIELKRAAGQLDTRDLNEVDKLLVAG